MYYSGKHRAPFAVVAVVVVAVAAVGDEVGTRQAPHPHTRCYNNPNALSFSPFYSGTSLIRLLLLYV